MEKSTKNWWTAFLLNFFLGSFGAHYFYVGKTMMGIIRLIAPTFLIWSIVDLVRMLMYKFADKEGKILMR
jgi:TM2 domain-containing membrane protein YozV